MASFKLTALTGALLAAYPALVYLGLRRGVPARFIALGLVAVLAVRWGGTMVRKLPVPALAAVLAAAAALAWIWGEASVLYYPVAVNLTLLLAFGLSLRFPPTVIERLARLRHPDLDARGALYTRRVTRVWCGFFVLNGGAALATALSGNAALWAFYNGFLVYLLMGLLFAGEWLVRRRVMSARRR
ncbi:MAG TPA: hypothetical protein VJ385_08040 [Fibrobacteria bacterium]|nr:hypothetical protein [Fibrobacteria bacterium]